MNRAFYALYTCFWIPQLLMMFFVLLSYHNLIKSRKERKKSEIGASSNLQNNRGEKASREENTNGIAIYNSVRKKIGIAPPADPPQFLIPFSSNNTNLDITNRGQRFLDPTHWSLTIANFILIGDYILKTETWRILSKTKGGAEFVTMHDINSHFTIPWTTGSGCSLALLLDFHPGKVELMLSHSWSGSFIQTFAAMKTLVTMHFLSPDTLVFFCAFSQYQAGDGVPNGLSIQEQLDIEPFGKVIESRPRFGMSVIHTDKSEVYERLWCVDEVYEARKAGIEVFALFDPSMWSLSKFGKTIEIKTEDAECSDKNDERKLRKKINSGDGFAPLDATIRKFRKRATKDLGLVLTFRASFGDLKYDPNESTNQNGTFGNANQNNNYDESALDEENVEESRE